MGTQEKHGNYSCDDSFEEIGDPMVEKLGFRLLLQTGQSGKAL